MAWATLQLVVQYDGARFSGWQRQPERRTVQGELERALERLNGAHIRVTGAGRTDAGVHARGQAAGVVVAEKWTASELRRALNAILPADIWIASAMPMEAGFHARYSAISRRYSYYIGTDDAVRSPFRAPWEWGYARPLDRAALDDLALAVRGRHCFRAFAVRGTAPEGDDHQCEVRESLWRNREGGLVFEIEANRFLHHMVRFLVGTMVDIAARRRPDGDLNMLLSATDNAEVSAPAPAHALFLDRVEYPADLYLDKQ